MGAIKLVSHEGHQGHILFPHDCLWSSVSPINVLGRLSRVDSFTVLWLYAARDFDMRHGALSVGFDGASFI